MASVVLPHGLLLSDTVDEVTCACSLSIRWASWDQRLFCLCTGVSTDEARFPAAAEVQALSETQAAAGPAQPDTSSTQAGSQQSKPHLICVAQELAAVVDSHSVPHSASLLNITCLETKRKVYVFQRS